MKIQVKKIGGSLGLILPSTICKYYNLKANDWVDMPDLIVLPKNNTFVELKDLSKKREVEKK